MRVAYVILRVSLRKGRYNRHLQWYIMRKVPEAWDNSYGAGVIEIGDNIFPGTVRVRGNCVPH